MRQDDANPTRHFQTDRFVTVGDRWYFLTREGEQLGPFESKVKAESRLRDYLATQATIRKIRRHDPLLNDSNRDNAKQIAELSRDLQKKRQDER